MFCAVVVQNVYNKPNKFRAIHEQGLEVEIDTKANLSHNTPYEFRELTQRGTRFLATEKSSMRALEGEEAKSMIKTLREKFICHHSKGVPWKDKVGDAGYELQVYMQFRVSWRSPIKIHLEDYHDRALPHLHLFGVAAWLFNILWPPEVQMGRLYMSNAALIIDTRGNPKYEDRKFDGIIYAQAQPDVPLESEVPLEHNPVQGSGHTQSHQNLGKLKAVPSYEVYRPERSETRTSERSVSEHSKARMPEGSISGRSETPKPEVKVGSGSMVDEFLAILDSKKRAPSKVAPSNNMPSHDTPSNDTSSHDGPSYAPSPSLEASTNPEPPIPTHIPSSPPSLLPPRLADLDSPKKRKRQKKHPTSPHSSGDESIASQDG